MDDYAEKHSNLWGATYMMEEEVRRCFREIQLICEIWRFQKNIVPLHPLLMQ